jgi:peptidoglycan/LPS O-acetylase OafA/YrhL
MVRQYGSRPICAFQSSSSSSCRIHGAPPHWPPSSPLCCWAVTAATDSYGDAYHSGSLDAYDGIVFYIVIICLGGFFLGILTVRAGITPRPMGLAAFDSIGLLTLAAVVVAFSAGFPNPVIIALFPVVVTCLSRTHGVIAWIFANRVIYSPGVWSYAMYMLHPVFQTPSDLMNDTLGAYMPHDLATILSSLIVVVLLLIFSFVLHTCIEMPGRRAIQRMALQMPPR